MKEGATRESAEKHRELLVRPEVKLTERSALASLVRRKKAQGATSEIPPSGMHACLALHVAAAGNGVATRVAGRAAREFAEKRREPSVRLEIEFTERSAFASLVRRKKA